MTDMLVLWPEDGPDRVTSVQRSISKANKTNRPWKRLYIVRGDKLMWIVKQEDRVSAIVCKGMIINPRPLRRNRRRLTPHQHGKGRCLIYALSREQTAVIDLEVELSGAAAVEVPYNG